MSDVDRVVSALPRVLHACRARHTVDPASGKTLSTHQVGILSHLDRVDPAMVSELAGQLGVTASTMSINLRRLERDGYIVRERDPADRRVTNVRLTEAGDRVRRASALLDPERVEAMLRELDPAPRATAIRGLALLAAAADSLVVGGRS